MHGTGSDHPTSEGLSPGKRAGQGGAGGGGLPSIFRAAEATAGLQAGGRRSSEQVHGSPGAAWRMGGRGQAGGPGRRRQVFRPQRMVGFGAVCEDQAASGRGSGGTRGLWGRRLMWAGPTQSALLHLSAHLVTDQVPGPRWPFSPSHPTSKIAQNAPSSPVTPPPCTGPGPRGPRTPGRLLTGGDRPPRAPSPGRLVQAGSGQSPSLLP